MRRNIKKYVKERNEMLKKCSVKELRKFVAKHREYYDGPYIDAFTKASDEVLEVSLHKMIVNVPSLPEELRSNSARWLVLRGYDLNTY